MKIFRLPQLADATPDGQFVLGPEALGTETVSLLYGRLRPNEMGRRICPEPGHEAVVCVVHGRLDVKRGRDAFAMSAGEAFLFVNDETMTIDNPDETEAVYIAACAPCAGRVPAAPDVPGLSKPEPEAAVSVAPPATPPEPPEPKDEVAEEQEFEISLDDEEPTEEPEDEPPPPKEP